MASGKSRGGDARRWDTAAQQKGLSQRRGASTILIAISGIRQEVVGLTAGYADIDELADGYRAGEENSPINIRGV